MVLSVAVALLLLPGIEDVELPRCFRDEPETCSVPLPFSGFEALSLGIFEIPSEESARQEDEPPHGSFLGFFDRHASSKGWKEGVWEEYLATPAIILPASLAIGAVAIVHWDKRLEAQWEGRLGKKQTWSNIGVYTVLAASVATGALLPGEGRNTWDETWTVAESYLASYLTTTVLKSTISRYRPGHGTHSFPSGHSAMAFTGATLMESNLGPVGGIPAYGLAAFTAFERVEAGRHFPSDVLAGAAIGTLSAGIIDALHWGGGPGKGGIANRSVACDLDVQGLHAFALQVSIGF